MIRSGCPFFPPPYSNPFVNFFTITRSLAFFVHVSTVYPSYDTLYPNFDRCSSSVFSRGKKLCCSILFAEMVRLLCSRGARVWTASGTTAPRFASCWAGLPHTTASPPSYRTCDDRYINYESVYFYLSR
jgi:hypothetical protein